MDARLVALETILPTLATKSDVQGAVNDLTKWMVGTAVALAAAAIVVMTFVLNNAVPKALPAAPAAQAPIVIQLPPQAAVPPAPAASR